MKLIKKALIFVLFIPVFHCHIAEAQFFDEQSFKIAKVLHLISRYYVDSTDEKELAETAIINMLHKLDPHSTYISADEVKAMNEELTGNFEGIGITFNILNDTIYVISPISGGPSEKVGIMPGDRIIKVDGKNVAGIDITSKGVRDKLLGEKGTKVTVGIKRKGVKKILFFTITRDIIPIYSVDASYPVNEETGYIKLNRFSKTTMQEFFDATDKLKKEGVRNLILDLTGNSGGYLEVAIQLADQFFEDERLIVYTQGLKSDRNEYKSDTGSSEFQKVIVMIDEGSASASEIVAGAIQDWDRGIVAGRRSFGKGLVQRPFKLSDGSMIRLTIARYYTPTGRLIQKPYTDDYSAYRKDIINRINHGELISADSIDFPDSLKHYTLNNKRVVYGGGGIMPDFFVPVDTSYLTDFYQEIISTGILSRFVLNHVDNNRKKIKRDYPDFNSFKNKFVVDDELINEMIKYAKENNEEAVNHQDMEASVDHIKMLIKAYIARDIWATNEFYQVYNDHNRTLLKAISIMNDKRLYDETLGVF